MDAEDAAETDDAGRVEIQQRLAEIESGAVQTEQWADAKTRLAQKFRRAAAIDDSTNCTNCALWSVRERA